MARFRLRKLAREDLLGIGEYTARRWSDAQEERYVSELYATFQKLADTPMLDRPHPAFPGYCRYLQRSHVVFYRREQSGNVVIVRILHERMLPGLHLGDPADEESPTPPSTAPA
jgi:toxin ParE1/3/4